MSKTFIDRLFWAIDWTIHIVTKNKSQPAVSLDRIGEEDVQRPSQPSDKLMYKLLTIDQVNDHVRQYSATYVHSWAQDLGWPVKYPQRTVLNWIEMNLNWNV